MTVHKRKIPAIGKCFDHLGGRLAPLLFNRLIDMRWIQPKGSKKTIFEATEEGRKQLKEIFNIDIDEILQEDP